MRRDASCDAYVVGGAGFLGTYLVPALVAGGWRVAVIDPAARAAEDAHLVPSVVADDALAALARDGWRPRRIFHLGGSGSVGHAAQDPDADHARTVRSTELLVRRFGGGDVRLVFVSSGAVYGDAGEAPIVETCAPRPISTYGEHKLAAEQLIEQAGGSHAIVRFFSLYGPGLRKQLLWDACRKLEGSAPSFDGTGAERRDFMHVDDAVRLLLLAAESEQRELTVNGGTGIGTTVERALGVLRRALGTAVAPRFTGVVRPGDPRHLVADIGRARAIGFTPAISLEEGLAAYARWFEAAA